MGINYGPPPIVGTKMFFCVDALDPTSYPRSGNTVYDIIGTNDMTRTGATYNSNGWFTYDGNDNLRVSTTDFRFSTSFSCGVWFNITAFTNSWFRVIDHWKSPGNGWGVMRYSNTSKVEWRLDQIDITGDGTFVTGDLSTDTWYYFLGVYNSDANTAQLYLNGSLVDSGNTSGTMNSLDTDLTIGQNNQNTEAFNGSIGPVQIYKTALTAGDALKNFNAQRDRFGV